MRAAVQLIDDQMALTGELHLSVELHQDGLPALEGHPSSEAVEPPVDHDAGLARMASEDPTQTPGASVAQLGCHLRILTDP
jgi:hypothetical protein